jgi:beta-barrel assembly-enhancing protease
MRTAARSTLLILGLAALPLLGCSTSDLFGNAAGVVAGGGRAGEVARAAVGGASDTAVQMNRALSPEQEYFLGRAVAAQAIARYGLDPDEKKQDYLRKVGAAIVAISERLNATYGGYHFGVLNTDTENGLSGPGGFVMITRGAMLRCRSEDELAGILCHELAHITLKHGEAVMRAGGPWQQNMGAIFQVVAAAAGADDQSIRPDMVKFFGEAAGDLFKTLAENGYGKAYEYQADKEGTLLLYDVGYDASAIQTYLAAAEGREAKSWDTHPPAAERIAALDQVVKEFGHGFDGGVGKEARAARWKAFLEGKPIDVPLTKPEPATAEPKSPPPEPPADADGSAPGVPPVPALPEPPAGSGAAPLR